LHLVQSVPLGLCAIKMVTKAPKLKIQVYRDAKPSQVDVYKRFIGTSTIPEDSNLWSHCHEFIISQLQNWCPLHNKSIISTNLTYTNIRAIAIRDHLILEAKRYVRISTLKSVGLRFQNVDLKRNLIQCNKILTSVSIVCILLCILIDGKRFGNRYNNI
jgi:hypothetical protein